MLLQFYKYQGAGNDFILVDNRKKTLNKPKKELVAHLCNRRFGIGADGLMLLELVDGYDFRMIYYNSDGSEGSMCGNGGRCIVAFAQYLKLINLKTSFLAIDGPHEATVISDNEVNLKMIDVLEYEQIGSDYYLNTGSPHYVRLVDDLSGLDVFNQGRAIRYNARFAAVGTNVNFLKINDLNIEVATYERGVEDETLACGTGVVASSIVAAIVQNEGKTEFDVQAKGGKLRVSFEREAPQSFRNLWLQGPADFVFQGTFDISNFLN